MEITKNFKLSEFTKSETADKKGITNIPDTLAVFRLKSLCENLLQPLRDLYNAPFHINSGYRSPELNKAVGGSANSQHQYGEAADIFVKEPKKLLQTLRASGLVFDQAILYPTFLHLSYSYEGNNRKQILQSL